MIFQAQPATSRLVQEARFHHLDALRAFALLLGVAFHAAQSFGAHNHYWAIVDSSPSTILERFCFGSHSFRMALFFLIAGFFARLLFLRRGAAGFVHNRLQRILVPLIVGWLVLCPMIVYLWLWGSSVSGALAKAGVPAQFQHLPLWKLPLGFFLSGTFLRKLDLAHLWFLYQLLIIYLLVLVVRWVWCLLDGSGVQAARCDRWFERLYRSPMAVLLFALLCLPMLLRMREWGVDTPNSSLLPYPPTTLFYGFCFLVGWLLNRQPELVKAMGRRWPWHLVLGLGLCLWLSGALASVPVADLLLKQVHSLRLAYTACYSVMMWSFVLGFLGLFTRFCQRPSAWGRYLADASYWIYLVHLPLVIALQVIMARSTLPWLMKFPLIVAVAISVLLLTYQYLVRSSWIGLLLNGHRYERRWPRGPEQTGERIGSMGTPEIDRTSV